MQQLQQDQNRSRWSRILRTYMIFYPYQLRHRLRILLAGLFGSVFMSLLNPWPLKLIIDSILLNKPLPEQKHTLQVLLGSNKAVLWTDLILLIEEGRIIEQRAHTDLLTNSGVYRWLCDLQSSHFKSGDREERLSLRIG